MLYEYLASGRCSQLEGHEGAYNIYEQELRLGIIISKLDDIIDRLDEIKDSQYALVSAVREGNQTAKRICDAVTRCSEKLDSIDTNTEITRYNSEITAFNSTYMAWFQKYHNVKIVE